MRVKLSPRRNVARLTSASIAFTLTVILGCGSTEQTVGLAVGLTAAGAYSPAQEIEQFYYLGVFDPQEQVPPTIYRLTVRGQASMISLMRFASGWVPANIADTLNTSIEFDDQGQLTVDQNANGNNEQSGIANGRRLILFGPEGFREAPRNHRLVIAMGTSPESFFEAVGDSLSEVADVQIAQLNQGERQAIAAQMLAVQKERQQLDELRADVASEFAATKGGE